jgi:ABC-type uncharacterized transport system auxiliary subunit
MRAASPTWAAVPVWAAALALAAAAACGSVEIPDEVFYRLQAPRPAAHSGGVAGALRLERLALAAHLVGDHLLVAEGPVALRPYRFHRWAGPPDELLGDALLTGLTRSGAFERVLGPADPGPALLRLSARVLDFQQQVTAEGEWAGRFCLEVQLLDAERDRLLLREELAAVVPARERRPEAVVAALSAAVERVVDPLRACAARRGLFDLPRPAPRCDGAGELETATAPPR